MLQNLFSIRQFRITKWSFLVHNTTHNAPYIQPSHDLILELWRTFPNAFVFEDDFNSLPPGKLFMLFCRLLMFLKNIFTKTSCRNIILLKF